MGDSKRGRSNERELEEASLKGGGDMGDVELEEGSSSSKLLCLLLCPHQLLTEPFLLPVGLHLGPEGS